MNPPDVVVDLSILELFKNAHIVVKFVTVSYTHLTLPTILLV